MKYFILIFAVLLSGCFGTAPVKPKFPGVPTILTEKCESLRKIEGDNYNTE